MLQVTRREKKCKACPTRFVPTRPLQVACCPDCAQIIADAANKAADYNNLRDYELLRALENAIRARGSA